jgi:hypothetical protein
MAERWAFTLEPAQGEAAEGERGRREERRQAREGGG